MHTFIADYPSEKNIKDGMMIRIKEIDEKFINQPRQYLDIRYLSFFINAPKPDIISDNCTVYHYNFFVHFFQLIQKVKSSQTIYIHTIYNYIKVVLLLNYFFKKKKVALDLHGVIPEELNYQGQFKLSKLFGWIEYFAFKRVNYFIYVTDAMQNHFSSKYASQLKKNKYTHVTYGIITSVNNIAIDEKKIEEAKKTVNLHEGETLFIYSGGLQKWQRIDLMLESVKQLLVQNNKYKIALFTGQVDELKQILCKYELENKVYVGSVMPSELVYYYSIAHYGFVLRDDHILNRVSNPTKLSEYLAFGIKPIVLCEQIGDYYNMGYEYVSVNQLMSQHFEPTKSTKNSKVYDKYIQSMKLVEVPFQDC